MNERRREYVWCLAVAVAGVLALTPRPGMASAATPIGGIAADSAAVESSQSTGGAATTPAGEDDPIPEELRASTAPPWVPDQPVPSERPWESALRMPGRIVTLPLSGLGYVTKHTFLLIEETNFINRVRVTFEPLPKAGIRITPASLGDRTGFGLGVAYLPPVLRHHLIARWEGSLLKYSRTSVEAAWGPARLGWRYEWRPRERFYGIGPETSDDDRTTFASQSQSVRFGFEQQLRRDREMDSPRWTIAGWVGPREIVTRRGREDEDPSFEEIFPSLLPFLNQREEHLVYGGRLQLDHRRGAPHWAEGGRTSVEVERFGDPVKALAFRTTRTPFRHTRWTYEAEGGASFYRDPRTFRLELQVIDNVPDGSAGGVMPPDLASLGGGRGLYGFAPGRFYDNDAALARLSYIFPLALRLEMDVHAETGQVAHDVWKDVSLTTLEQSYGIALRPRFENALLAMIGVDWSRETLRVRFSVGGVE